jgi:hypothetical protein
MKHYCGQRKAVATNGSICKIVKSKLISIIFMAALLSLAGSCFAQGFVNLNFENGTMTPDLSSPYYPYSVYASNAIPGWTAYINGNPLSRNDAIGSDF